LFQHLSTEQVKFRIFVSEPYFSLRKFGLDMTKQLMKCYRYFGGAMILTLIGGVASYFLIVSDFIILLRDSYEGNSNDTRF